MARRNFRAILIGVVLFAMVAGCLKSPETEGHAPETSYAPAGGFNSPGNPYPHPADVLLVLREDNVRDSYNMRATGFCGSPPFLLFAADFQNQTIIMDAQWGPTSSIMVVYVLKGGVPDEQCRMGSVTLLRWDSIETISQTRTTSSSTGTLPIKTHRGALLDNATVTMDGRVWFKDFRIAPGEAITWFESTDQSKDPSTGESTDESTDARDVASGNQTLYNLGFFPHQNVVGVTGTCSDFAVQGTNRLEHLLNLCEP